MRGNDLGQLVSGKAVVDSSKQTKGSTQIVSRHQLLDDRLFLLKIAVVEIVDLADDVERSVWEYS